MPFRSIIVAIVLVVAWLMAGRQLAMLVDQIVTTPAVSLPIAPLEYDGGGFRIGKLQMTFGATNNLRSDIELRSDSSNRVVLSSGGKTFQLGPRTNLVDPSGRPEIYFVAEPGDELSCSSSRSLIGWPTPFEFSFMPSHSPWWKRYVYYRLVWKKRSGAKLEMRWRYEQDYLATSGWSEPAMMWNGQTGLLRVDIAPG